MTFGAALHYAELAIVFDTEFIECDQQMVFSNYFFTAVRSIVTLRTSPLSPGKPSNNAAIR